MTDARRPQRKKDLAMTDVESRRPQGAYEYTVIQIITIAAFRKPARPTRCNLHRYHVWRWRSPVKLERAELKEHMPKGLKCQCGCLEN